MQNATRRALRKANLDSYLATLGENMPVGVIAKPYLRTQIEEELDKLTKHADRLSALLAITAPNTGVNAQADGTKLANMLDTRNSSKQSWAALNLALVYKRSAETLPKLDPAIEV